MRFSTRSCSLDLAVSIERRRAPAAIARTRSSGRRHHRLLRRVAALRRRATPGAHEERRIRPPTSTPPCGLQRARVFRARARERDRDRPAPYCRWLQSPSRCALRSFGTSSSMMRQECSRLSVRRRARKRFVFLPRDGALTSPERRKSRIMSVASTAIGIAKIASPRSVCKSV